MSERDPVTGRFPKGNGAGWGGPKRESFKLKPAGDPMSDAIRAMARDPKAAQEAKIPLRELTLETWVDVALNSENDGARNVAAEKLAERIGLAKEPTETRVTGAEGGAIVIERRIVDPDD